MNPTERQKLRMDYLNCYLSSPLPPWWPTWYLYVRSLNGLVPTSMDRLDQQLDEESMRQGIGMIDIPISPNYKPRMMFKTGR